jgi:hypothetical protein
MAERRFIDTDEVKPNEIEHKCEETFDGETLEQRYNYIVYHFDCDGSYFWARSYADELHTVSVFGPFDRRDTKEPISRPLDQAMLSYLKRRFKKIQTLGSEGYVTLWTRAVANKPL